MTEEDAHTVVQRAAAHGLRLAAESLRVNEAGLDYRVVFARAEDGSDWVLRVPRRVDVAEKIADEARILALVARELPVRVPDWRVCTRELVAYPLLPGEPGLTLDETSGEPVWHFEPTSPVFAESLGRLIAALHQIDVERARAAGLVVQSPAELRAEWRSNIAKVAAELPISARLHERWRAWLDDDGYWPERTTFTHGELYPAHVLIDAEGHIQSVLDWTTAKVGDPAVDFVYQHMLAGPSFEVTVRAYEEAGGRAHPRLAERCAELLAAGPVLYGLYALTTGDPEHRRAAAAQLNPEG